jgi:hypothetical protein
MNLKNADEIKEIFFINIGSTWFLDSAYLYFITPLGLAGCILNSICIYIFSKLKDERQPVYKYFKFNNFISLLNI